jgi:hypothetical protein
VWERVAIRRMRRSWQGASGAWRSRERGVPGCRQATCSPAAASGGTRSRDVVAPYARLIREVPRADPEGPVKVGYHAVLVLVDAGSRLL